MRTYTRLSWCERLQIEALYNAGHSYAFIARQLGRSTSSIYLDIQHGLYEHMGAETTRRPWRYSAVRASDYARYQATIKGSPLKMGFNFCFAYDVRDMIASGRSVEHIVNEKKSHGQFTVSVSTLYRYIDRGFIPDVTNRDLPCRGMRKRKKSPVRLSRLPHGSLITDRPFTPDDRSEFGHWEFDSIIGKSKGKRESLLVLTERKTRFEIILRTASKTSAATVAALDSALSKFPQQVFKSLTVDNGCEFQDCFGMEHDRNGNKRLQVYYCHPYTSCERGSNERANRIIRRFFPKHQSLAKVTQKECNHVSSFINTMRRRILNYDTSAERFIQELNNIQSPLKKNFNYFFDWA